jgi:hypothetical protein
MDYFFLHFYTVNKKKVIWADIIIFRSWFPCQAHHFKPIILIFLIKYTKYSTSICKIKEKSVRTCYNILTEIPQAPHLSSYKKKFRMHSSQKLARVFWQISILIIMNNCSSWLKYTCGSNQLFHLTYRTYFTVYCYVNRIVDCLQQSHISGQGKNSSWPSDFQILTLAH